MPLPGSIVPYAGHIPNKDYAGAFDREVDRFPEGFPVR